jgi:hypothetical protein
MTLTNEVEIRHRIVGNTGLESPVNRQARMLAAPQVDGGGNFSFINPANPDAQRAFYRLKLP